MIKSQDFLLLIKLVGLKKNRQKKIAYGSNLSGHLDAHNPAVDLTSMHEAELYQDISVRNLGYSLGISKTEISASLKRCIDSKLLVFLDSRGGELLNINSYEWTVNLKALFNLIQYAFPYFYPIRQTGLAYGMRTCFSAPILADEILSAGDTLYVWPIESGDTFGIGIEPIYKSVAFAASHDKYIYDCFALIDAIRMGNSRERNVALNLLEHALLGK